MDSDYSSDEDNVIFMSESGNIFPKEEWENLLLTKINPNTNTPLTENDITTLHKLLIESEDDEEDTESLINEVIEQDSTFFKYPYLTLYVAMAAQLGYIIWSII